MNNPNNINIGDTVMLKMTHPQKQGIVQALIPAGESVLALIPDGTKRSHMKFDKNISKIDRALVAVKMNDKAIWYYAPIASTCEKSSKKSAMK